MVVVVVASQPGGVVSGSEDSEVAGASRSPTVMESPSPLRT